MRKTIETIGATTARSSEVVTELSSLELDDSTKQNLLESVRLQVESRLPKPRDPYEITTSTEERLGYPSTYRPAGEESGATICFAEETLADPLRALMEMSYQYSTHYWHGTINPTPLDIDPRTTHLMPICCGLGVLASDASLCDKQWSQAGWAGWSMSRTGYYTPVEIGYAMALWARVRGEANPKWASALRLDSRDTAKRAWRYFAQHERDGGQLLFDANKVPASSQDMSELATLLKGNDRTFALAAAYALTKRTTELSPLAIDAAVVATSSGDKDLVPVATRLLCGARGRNEVVEARVKKLIGDESPQTSLAAIEAAEANSVPLLKFGKTISKLLDVFAEDSFRLLDVIGRQGTAFEFLSPKICTHLGRAIHEKDDELATALLDCLGQIAVDPRGTIEKQVKSPEIRRQALERLSQTSSAGSFADGQASP